MIRAVIFDLDGVIVSTDDLHFKAWRMLAEKLGIKDFTRRDNMRQRGVSRMESLGIVLEKSGASYSPDEKARLADWKNERYVEMLGSLNRDAILPGVSETLERLRARPVLLAIGSSSRNTGLILRQIGLESAFDAVCGGQDITKSKPDPEIFLLAAKRLGVPPGDCLVVEDADAGIKAATAAGMTALAVGAAFENRSAAFRAHSLSDAAAVWDAVL